MPNLTLRHDCFVFSTFATNLCIPEIKFVSCGLFNVALFVVCHLVFKKIERTCPKSEHGSFELDGFYFVIALTFQSAASFLFIHIYHCDLESWFCIGGILYLRMIC